MIWIIPITPGGVCGKVHNLGFPQIGTMRELNFAGESYWSEKSNKENLLKLLGQTSEIRKINWKHQESLDLVAVGDFSLYDQVLDVSFTLGNLPYPCR
jgi:5-methyltetrahydropteroyltriglutamate--homocysteine methyltransferase